MSTWDGTERSQSATSEITAVESTASGSNADKILRAMIFHGGYVGLPFEKGVGRGDSNGNEILRGSRGRACREASESSSFSILHFVSRAAVLLERPPLNRAGRPSRPPCGGHWYGLPPFRRDLRLVRDRSRASFGLSVAGEGNVTRARPRRRRFGWSTDPTLGSWLSACVCLSSRCRRRVVLWSGAQSDVGQAVDLAEMVGERERDREEMHVQHSMSICSRSTRVKPKKYLAQSSPRST